MMMDPTVEKDLHEQLGQLDEIQQQRVVEFARSFAGNRARGVPGRVLLRFRGAIEQGELNLIAQAVEAGCELVHPDDC